jgi:hypothetical protein
MQGRKNAVKRLFKGLKLFYYIIKYVLPLTFLGFIVYILFDDMIIPAKIFFIVETAVIGYFIRRIMFMIDENLMRTN